MEGSGYLEIGRAAVPIRRRYRRRVLSWRLLSRRQASTPLLPFGRSVPPLSESGGWTSEDCRRYLRIHMPNQALHATATVLCDCVAARKHSTVVAAASALPVAVRELDR